MSGVEPCLSLIFAFHADRKCRLAELSNKYFSVKMSVFFFIVFRVWFAICLIFKVKAIQESVEEVWMQDLKL